MGARSDGCMRQAGRPPHSGRGRRPAVVLLRCGCGPPWLRLARGSSPGLVGRVLPGQPGPAGPHAPPTPPAGLVERHFINMCTCGASAAAAVCLDRYRWAGRLGAYTLAAAEALLLRYKRQPALLRLDGGAWVRLRSLTLSRTGR